MLTDAEYKQIGRKLVRQANARLAAQELLVPEAIVEQDDHYGFFNAKIAIGGHHYLINKGYSYTTPESAEHTAEVVRNALVIKLRDFINEYMSSQYPIAKE